MNDTPEYLLHRLVMEMDKIADKILTENLGISFTRGRFLAVLLQCGTLTQHDLAVTLGHSDPSVSKMLLELSKDGYVTVQIDPRHARKRLVSITPKAEALTIKGTQLLNAHFGDIMKRANVDPEQYALLTQKLLAATIGK